MKRWRTCGMVGGLLTAASVLATDSDDFARYQVIIDRSPFGSVAASGLAEATPNFALRFQFVALVMSNAGQGPVQAIIYEKTANRSYFKAQGDQIDEQVKVVRIDTEPTPKVVLQSGLEKAELTFQPRSAGSAAAVPAPNFQQPNAAAPVPVPQPPQRGRIPFRRSNG